MNFTKPLRFALLTCFLLFLVFSTQGTAQSQQDQVDSLSINAVSEGYKLDVLVLKNSESSKKMPAIIFSVGSGDLPWTRSYGNLLHFYFENTFLPNDFAVVYFDKRGVGKSEGIWYETTFEQRALDVKNVALEIQKLDFIDPENIFVIGHSQGGWITQIVMALYPDIFAGGISMAGPTFGVRKQLVNDYMSENICNGMKAERALRRAKRKVNRDIFLISLFARRGNLKQLKVIKDFEPKPFIKNIEKPLLFLFAENDPLVNPEWSIEDLHTIFPNGIPENISYYVAPGEDHSFRISPMCFAGSPRDLEPSIKTRNLMFDWVNDLLILSKKQ